MSFLDRLRPRWRRSDPDERVAAVRDMGPGDQGRLGTLATSDPEPRVRRAAIKRLEDPAVLDAVSERDPDAALRAAASERANEVRVAAALADGPVAECAAALAAIADERGLIEVAVAAVHADVRGSAAGRLTTDRALREVVQRAADRALAREALARIGDQATLRAIAVGEGAAELALAALERIEDVEILRGITSHRSVSKALRRRARELLPADTEQAPDLTVEAARARQNELGSRIQAVRAMTDLVLAEERAHEAEREWRELERVIEPKPEAAARFLPVCRAILEDAERLRRDREDAARAKSREEAPLAARRALCARVEALEATNVSEQIAAAIAEWERLDAAPGSEAAELERRFRAACAARRKQSEDSRRAEADRAELLALVEEAERLVEERAEGKGGANRWTRLEARWDERVRRDSTDRAERAAAVAPDIEALRLRFADVKERVHQKQEAARARRDAIERENLARVEALAGRLEALSSADALKLSALRAELKNADAALADLGPLPASERRAAWKERLLGARTLLTRRLSDLEEAERWRRWANTGVQEAIIERAEALRASEDLGEVHAQLKHLQDEWTQSATASPGKSQELWERFRAVRDELRARVNVFLGENLEKKRALCERVAQVGDSSSWKETADLIKQAQAEWKELGPVPQRHAQEIWRRFREPCDRFFARRTEHFARQDEERRGNASRQEKLCERAEALADSTEWEATAGALKELQAEWKRSGPAPRDQSDLLWARFRTACDTFFDRFHRRDAIEREQALEGVRRSCEQIEALAAAAAAAATSDAPLASEEVRAQLDEAWGGWLRLDLGYAGDAGEVHARLAAACASVAAAAPDALPGSRIDPSVTAKRRERLCERVEALAPVSEAATAEEPKAQSLQEQVLALRERIATNTIAKGEGAADRSASAPADAELRQIRVRWVALGPLLDDEARRLDERFRAALARLDAVARDGG